MKNRRPHNYSPIINVSLQKMKILCKEAFIIIYHGFFCRISHYCTLAWHDPRDAAVYHLHGNEQVLLKSLSHTGLPYTFTATASPLNSLTLLLLIPISRRALQGCIAKSRDLQESQNLRSILLKYREVH